MEIHERRCGNCKFFHKLEYGFETGKVLKESSCCIVFTRMYGMYESPNSYDSPVVETTENEMCEMWTEAREDEVSD